MTRTAVAGFLFLVLQLGVAHAIQHDLHAFDHAAHDTAHDAENCLLADTPQNKAVVETGVFLARALPSNDVPPIVLRRSAKFSLTGSPRAPPFSL